MEKLTPSEQETIIHYDHEYKTARIYTCDKRLRDKLNKLCITNKDIVCNTNRQVYAEYTCPKNWVKISPPRKVNLTEEQRQAARERLLRGKSTTE